MITAKAFAGKHYAVLGLARSGLATVEALLASGARVTAWDDSEDARDAVPTDAAIEDFVGGDLARFDSIVVTPGLPLNRHPIAKRAADAGVEIIGDIELFARARPELSPHKVVGITGTNGKSTTTALVHHILQTAGVPSLMGGNIGLPILSQDPLPEGGVYVLELSSYQIDLTKSLDCDVAVLLNITPDHLDRYEDFAAYRASKLRLFEMQSHEHTAIYATDDDDVFAFFMCLKEGAGSISRPIRGQPIEWPDQHLYPMLQGPHNAANIWAAEGARVELNVHRDLMLEALRTYPGLPHRMERIREIGGVVYVNDSKATNAEAAAPALAAYPRIRWIVGGQAKSEDLGAMVDYLDHVVTAYTIGEAGPMFARLLRGHGVTVTTCETLENAVAAAAGDSQPGETVLLSPASASFDQFRDFEARGDRFRELVGEL